MILYRDAFLSLEPLVTYMSLVTCDFKVTYNFSDVYMSLVTCY